MGQIIMKRNIRIKRWLPVALAAGLAVWMTGVSAFAVVKHIDLEPDMEDIPEHSPGEAFLPNYVLSDDEEDVTLDFGEGPEVTADPRQPYTLKVTVRSDNGALDDSLEIRGKGIRYTYVDYVSMESDEAEGRLLVYPFYQLQAPEPEISAAGEVRWAEVPYGGKYEYLITWTAGNGDEKQRHGTTKQCFVSAAKELAGSADGRIGVAIRAMASGEEAWAEAEVREGEASWEDMEWADRYRIRITYTDRNGRTVKREQTVNENTCNVGSYINSSADGNVRVTVRAVPRTKEASCYNIALSDFGYAGELRPDTDDYEVEDPWTFLADYTALVEGNFAPYYGNADGTAGYGSGTAGGTVYGGAYGSSAALWAGQAPGSSTAAVNTAGESFSGSWKREAYRWQYTVNGAPYDRGWLRIGSAWYYFDPDGYMHTGWLWDTDGKIYYLESKVGAAQGQMVTGEKEINGERKYFDASGALQ